MKKSERLYLHDIQTMQYSNICLLLNIQNAEKNKYIVAKY